MRTPAPAPFRAALLAALLSPFGTGCVLGSHHVETSGAIPCSTNRECPVGNVCFLGECRGNSSLLGTVYAEVRPPSNTPFAPAQRSGLDLRQSVIVDFALGGTTVGGRVVQNQNPGAGAPVPIAGAFVTFTGGEVIIPGRIPRARAQTGSAGDYSVLLSSSDAGTPWSVEVDAPSLPPARLPPQSFPPGAPPLDIALPAPAQLVRESGVASQGTTPLAGASVIAVDADGGTLSAGTTADGAGAFALSLPPNPFPYYVRVSGSGSTDAGSPLIPAFDPAGPFSGPPDAGFAALPPPAQLNGRVVDSSQRGIAAARVYALSLSGAGWVLSTSTVTASDGSFSLSLITGRYALEAAPGAAPSDPGLGTPQTDPDVPAGASTLAAPIVCAPKVSAQGVVLRPDGSPAGSGIQIAATRLPDRLVSSRVAQVSPTDGNGSYVITGDPGQYRVEFTPPFSPPNTLPRKLVTLTLLPQPAQQALPSVQLSAPLEVVGTVRAAATGTPVALATVDFFALDSASHPVLIGTGVTNSVGEYAIVLPDVVNPAAGTP